ncbi:MAG: tetratricopeptide repeat protein [Thermoplasmata archaeon]|nr:tetratricopeptide repeat protein [Thermoplasmata archaeon]
MTHRFDLAVHYFLRHEYENAVGAFRDVVRESPADGRAWAYLGIALAHLGLAVEAEGALSRSIALAPENAEAWFHLGVARSLRDEWASAAQAYQRTVALTPSDMVAWHRLGVALAESGDEPAATVAFERALVLSREVSTSPDAPEPSAPGSSQPSASRSRPAADDHLEETGEREGAREAKSWLDLALSLLSLGDEDEAVAAYERAYTLDPERARRSLFHPMLRLLNAVQDGAEAPEFPRPDDPRRPPEAPRRSPRTEVL